MELFTILTGVASLIGCVISIWQARKSKKSADRAESYKNTVYNNTVLSDVSAVSQKLSEVEAIMKEYKRCDKNDIPKGRNSNHDNKLFDDALSLLNLKMPLLPEETKNKVARIYKQISKKSMLDDIPGNIDSISRILRYLSECQINKKFE